MASTQNLLNTNAPRPTTTALSSTHPEHGNPLSMEGRLKMVSWECLVPAWALLWGWWRYQGSCTQGRAVAGPWSCVGNASTPWADFRWITKSSCFLEHHHQQLSALMHCYSCSTPVRAETHNFLPSHGMVSYQALLESKMGTCRYVHGAALTAKNVGLQGSSQEVLLSACFLRLIPPIHRDLERKHFPGDRCTPLVYWTTHAKIASEWNLSFAGGEGPDPTTKCLWSKMSFMLGSQI